MRSLLVVLLCGCGQAVVVIGDGGVGASDAGPSLDAGAPPDASIPVDAGLDGGVELDAGTDVDGGPTDAGLWQPTGDRDARGTPLPQSLPIGTYLGVMGCEFLGGTPAPGFGGSVPCGSYEVPVGQCNAGMRNVTMNGVLNTITRASLFVHEAYRVGNTYVGGNDIRYGQHQTQAFIMKFHTGGAGDFPVVGGLPPGALGTIVFNFVNQPNRGEVATRFGVLSTRPCDFDYARLDAQDPCFQRLGIAGGGSLLAHVVPPGVSPGPGHCALRPDTTYYLSTRWEDPLPATRGLISCRPQAGSPTGQHCGTSLAIQ